MNALRTDKHLSWFLTSMQCQSIPIFILLMCYYNVDLKTVCISCFMSCSFNGLLCLPISSVAIAGIILCMQGRQQYHSCSKAAKQKKSLHRMNSLLFMCGSMLLPLQVVHLPLSCFWGGMWLMWPPTNTTHVWSSSAPELPASMF